MNSNPSDKNPSSPEGRALLEKVRLLSIDVDGVMTDGGIYYADDGNTFRKFNAKDGMGLVYLRKAGIEVTIISSGNAGAIEHRATRLGVEHVYTDVWDKLETLKTVAEGLGLSLDQVAHMGDDINDLPVLDVVGCAIAPADAVPEVLAIADLVTGKSGGNGAVREICDILRGQAAERERQA